MLREYIKYMLIHLQGRMAVLQNDPARAVHYYEQALSLRPSDRNTLRALSNAYRLSADWNKFLSIFEYAEKIWPENIEVKLGHSINLMNFDMFEQAIPLLEFCANNWDQVPDGKKEGLANVFSKLGICYAYTEKWEQAEVVLQRALDQVPWNADAFYGQICVLYSTARADSILDYLDKKIEENPCVYLLHFWKADYLRYYLKDTVNIPKLVPFGSGKNQACSSAYW